MFRFQMLLWSPEAVALTCVLGVLALVGYGCVLVARLVRQL